MASSLIKRANKDGMKTTKMTDFFPRRSSNAGSLSNPSSSQLAAPPSQTDSTSRSKGSPTVMALPGIQSTVTTRSTIRDASDHAQGDPSGTQIKSQGIVPSLRLLPIDADALSVTSATPSKAASITSTRARRTSGAPKQRLVGKEPSTPLSTSGEMPVSRSRPSLAHPPDTSRRSSKRKHGQDDGAPPPTNHQSPKRRTRAKGKPNQASSPLTPRTNTVSARRSPRKKPRLSTPHGSGDDDASVVPSSQSDEELVLPKTLDDVPDKNIDLWRGEVEAVPEHKDEDYNMDTSEDGRLSIHMSSSLTPASSRPATPEYHLPSPVSPVPFASVPPSSSPTQPSASQPTPREHRLRTPPPTSSPSQLAVTPVALDRKTKTQNFLEEIKRNMAQKVAQDDDDSENGKGKRVELTLSDLDDSSDEEDWRPFASQKRVAGPSRTNPREQAGQHAALTTPSPDPEQDSTSPSSGPAWSWAVRPSRTRKAPERKLAPLTKKLPKKRKPFDPIGDLLKAQRRDEKQGKDIEAQRRAEGYDRDELLSEIHWDENDDLADENAAAQAARRGLKMRVGSETRSTDDGEDDGEDAEEVSEEMRIKLLGKDSGEAVGKIFANDRANKEDEEPVRGVNIWRVSVAGQESMDVDNILPEWINSPFDKEHPTLCILRDSALSGDVIAVMSMFQDLSHAHLADMPSAVHWLCELALSTRHDDLPRLAVQTLRDLDKSHKSNVPPLSSRFIKDVFTRLGMQPELLERFSCSSSTPALPRNALDNVLLKLISLVTLFAKAGWLTDYTQDPMPGAIGLLPILVGLDIDASQELRRDAMHAFECLLCSLPEDVSQSHLEESIARDIFDYARSLSYPNQAHLIATIPIHSLQSRRLARFIAYSLVTGALPDKYTDLPSLELLLDQLPFKITDSTDYNELGARVEVLSSALTDIPKYIAQEGLIRRGGALERARSTNVKGTTDQIYDRLMTMHGRISDTRAAHLDRSRAKDVIQRLAHRIHYDKAAAHGQKGRQSKLTDTIPRPRRVT